MSQDYPSLTRVGVFMARLRHIQGQPNLRSSEAKLRHSSPSIQSIGTRRAFLSPLHSSYHFFAKYILKCMIACSGAQTSNFLPLNPSSAQIYGPRPAQRRQPSPRTPLPELGLNLERATSSSGQPSLAQQELDLNQVNQEGFYLDLIIRLKNVEC